MKENVSGCFFSEHSVQNKRLDTKLGQLCSVMFSHKVTFVALSLQRLKNHKQSKVSLALSTRHQIKSHNTHQIYGPYST